LISRFRPAAASSSADLRDFSRPQDTSSALFDVAPDLFFAKTVPGCR